MIDLEVTLGHPSAPEAQIVTTHSNVVIHETVGVCLRHDVPYLYSVVDGISAQKETYSGVLLVLLANDVNVDWRFDVLVREAALANVAAIVIDPEQESLPTSVVSLAHRLGITLIVCREPAELYRHFLATLSDDWNTRRTSVKEILSLVATVPSLDEALSELERLLGVAVYLFDPTGFEVSERVSTHEFEHISSFDRLPDVGMGKTAIGSGQILFTVPINTDMPKPFRLGIVASNPSKSDVSTLSGLMNAAALVCAHVIMRSRLVDKSGAVERRRLIEELLHSDPDNPRAEIRRRIADIGWDVSDTQSVARIACSPAVDVVAATRIVKMAFEHQGVTVNIAEVDDGWFVWPHTTAHVARRDWEKLVRTANGEIRERIAASCGISATGNGLGEFIRSLSRAEDAARIAWNRPQSGYVAVADKLGLDQLLLSWTSADKFAYTAGEFLKQLENSGRDLTKTLLAYLDAESSITETAAVLDIHRNTVSERIKRIESVLDVSLDDPETRLALHLATRAELRFGSLDASGFYA